MRRSAPARMGGWSVSTIHREIPLTRLTSWEWIMLKKRELLAATVCITAAFVMGSRLASADGQLPGADPEPWPCYTFAEPVYACWDCEAIYNCGNCNDGNCDAVTWSGCTTTRDAKPALEGFKLITETSRCQTTFDCLKPSPCNGNACSAGTDPQGTQGNIVVIEKQGDPCVSVPV